MTCGWVEDMLAARGVIVSHQTVRLWAEKFCRQFANDMRKRSAGRLGDKWYLDAVVITIAGTKHWLWRAIDQDGFVLDVLVQSRRNAKAAKRLMRKLLKAQSRSPRVMITDKLRSYGAAKREIMPGVEHRSHKGLNNRAENCPDVQFVLDHCGNPLIDSGDISDWHRDIAALAKLPNVLGKISGIVNHAKPDWTPDDLRPAGRDTQRHADRALLGAVRSIVAGASQGEQERLFFRNAERIYRVKPRTKRYGFVLGGVKPEGISEYKWIHAAVWPQVLEQIKASNISNYSIFLREPENLLFAYYEYSGSDHDADMTAMAVNPVTRDWWKIYTPLQSPIASKTEQEWWAGMQEVFHID